MNKQVKESWDRIKEMIRARDIQPCPRINTDKCPYSDYSPFPDPENFPLCYDVSILMRCDQCIHNVFKDITETPDTDILTDTITETITATN